jgi:hypothetical protein
LCIISGGSYIYDKNREIITISTLPVYLKPTIMMKGKVMAIIYKVSRFWTVILPTVLLAATFQYAHQLNAIVNSIGDIGFKKTATLIFISFLAIWSLLYLGAIFFVRILKWIWRGTTTTGIEKPNIPRNKELKQYTKNSIEYHDVKEQENLFRLDLQDEPIDATHEEGRQENRVSK